MFGLVAAENNSFSCHVEAEDKSLVNRKGRKKSKSCPRTERQKVEVERDITIFKNPNSFINDQIMEQNMFSPDVIKQISTDGMDNYMKVIISTLDKQYGL